MIQGKNGRIFNCPVEAALAVVGGKWKPHIIYHLNDKFLRFSELQKDITGINARMLTKQLRELEEDEILVRKVYPEVPPRVEYALTDFGKTLIPIMDALCKWGERHYTVSDTGECGASDSPGPVKPCGKRK